MFEKNNPNYNKYIQLKKKPNKWKVLDLTWDIFNRGAHKSPLGHLVRGEFANFHQELHRGTVNVLVQNGIDEIVALCWTPFSDISLFNFQDTYMHEQLTPTPREPETKHLHFC